MQGEPQGAATRAAWMEEPIKRGAMRVLARYTLGNAFRDRRTCKPHYCYLAPTGMVVRGRRIRPETKLEEEDHEALRTVRTHAASMPTMANARQRLRRSFPALLSR